MSTDLRSELGLSLKTGSLVALYQLGGYVREIDSIMEHLRTKLGIDNGDYHNLAHVMWTLQKDNLIRFQERKGNSESVRGRGAHGASILTNVSITERGVQRARKLLGEQDTTRLADIGRLPKVHSGSRTSHAVGRDGTDFRQHGQKAEGGPIERIVPVKEEPLSGIPFVVLSDDEAAQYRQSKSGWPFRSPDGAKTPRSTNGKTHIDVETAPPEVPEVVEKPAEVLEKEAPSDTHTEYPGKATDVTVNFFPDLFPQIAAVLGKRERIERYTKAAELLGDDEAEIALTLLEKVQITPLEEEVLRLFGK